MPKCSNGEECSSFKIVGSGINFTGGRYVAKNFSTAAKRAGSQLYSKVHNQSEYKKYDNKPSIKFLLKETTKGGKKSTKAYEVFRVKLANPKVITLKGVEVTYKYNYKVEALKISEAEVSSLKM
jgi:hypothetical protein